MEEKFPGYHKFKKEDFSKLWSECIFVLDTNVLLNLYRYKIVTRDELLKIFDQIKDRIWIPHQVALEFHDERMNVINSLEAAYDKISGLEMGNHDKIKKELENHKERHPIIDVDRIIAVLDANYESIRTEIEKEKSAHPNWHSADYIKDKIYSIFEGRFGEPYSQKSLEDIYRRGELRYSLKIPPGYEDQGKKNEFPYKEYGDFVLWCQLIDESKRIKKPMIFVTDDTKKDWWIKKSSSIPCPELIQEFFLETEYMFYIYSPKDFVNWSKQYLKIEVANETIKEIEGVKLGDEIYYGDKATKAYSFSWNEIDRLADSEYEKMGKLRAKFDEEIEKNPSMTEEEANALILTLDHGTVRRHGIKIKYPKENDDFGHQ